MENKNKFQVVGFNKRDGYEEMVLLYLPEKDDPKFDDLPSEKWQPGAVVYADITPVNKASEPPFNKE